jgi:hypothetical protein
MLPPLAMSTEVTVSEVEAVEAQPKAETALEFLQKTYKGEIEPEGYQMRAAIAALPFESPKLSVVANINNHELGARLEQEIARAWSRSFGAPSRLKHSRCRAIGRSRLTTALSQRHQREAGLSAGSSEPD